MRKKKTAEDPLLKAELEVRESNEQVVEALNHLKEKVDVGVRTVDRIVEVSKKPAVLSAIALVVGMFIGQMLRMSFKNRPQRT